MLHRVATITLKVMILVAFIILITPIINLINCMYIPHHVLACLRQAGSALLSSCVRSQDLPLLGQDYPRVPRHLVKMMVERR
jgi:hypothetical protein